MPFDQVRRQGPDGGGGQHERAINLPPVILWIIVLNAVVQGARELLGDAADQNLVLITGAVPGANNGVVTVRGAVKGGKHA